MKNQNKEFFCNLIISDDIQFVLKNFQKDFFTLIVRRIQIFEENIDKYNNHITLTYV